jgi:hypothetical protein
MMTLLWNRPTDYYKDRQGNKKITKRRIYRVVVDGSEEALKKLLEKDSIQLADFPYKALKKPVKMTLDGITYDLYSIKQGAPRG